MRRRNARHLAIVLACLIGMGWPATATSPTLPKFPPVKFNPPKPERYVLPNGLIVYLLEDHELPLIKVQAMTRAGSQWEPVDKLGLGAVFGPALSEGGSLRFTPEQIEQLQDKTASSIGFGIDKENATGTMSCRSQDFQTVFAAFVDLLRHPQFRKDRVELAKEKLQEELRRLDDDAEEMARREFRRIVYGPTHPYARLPSPATVSNIKREDLVALHARYYKPNDTMLAVSGDFQTAAMKKAILEQLGDWEKADVTWPPLPPVIENPGRQLFYINRPFKQSQIRIGHLGLERHNPDHFSWEVFNELWGGSAISRLFRIVRTQQGLAYSVGSGFSEPAERGIIVAVSQTRGSQTIAATQSILKISQDVRPAPFGSDEIAGAKEAIQNRFIENYTSSHQIVTEKMGFEYYGFPTDYLETYTDNIGRVSEADLKRVGQKYLHPDDAKILIAGDLSTLEKPIATLGKPIEWKPVDYSQEAP